MNSESSPLPPRCADCGRVRSIVVNGRCGHCGAFAVVQHSENDKKDQRIQELEAENQKLRIKVREQRKQLDGKEKAYFAYRSQELGRKLKLHHAQASLSRAVEALEFYANGNNWQGRSVKSPLGYWQTSSAAREDEGSRARSVLQALKGGE